jgi:thiosulfate/3-mercaptopyruvate sulfurtransferase
VAYREGHIPGAIKFDLKSHLVGKFGAGRSPLPSSGEFATTAGEAGIDSDSIVVCYDDGVGGIAARAWWLLRHFGHARSYVLEGGFKAWPGPVETSAARPVSRTDFSVRTSLLGAVDADSVRTAIGNPRTAIIDARSADRFNGSAPPLDPVEGHIPGAVNLPANRSFENNSLREICNGTDTVIAYCGSGIVACNTILALVELGRDDALLYPGSWSDWAAQLEKTQQTSAA